MQYNPGYIAQVAQPLQPAGMGGFAGFAAFSPIPAGNAPASNTGFSNAAVT